MIESLFYILVLIFFVLSKEHDISQLIGKFAHTFSTHSFILYFSNTENQKVLPFLHFVTLKKLLFYQLVVNPLNVNISEIKPCLSAKFH